MIGEKCEVPCLCASPDPTSPQPTSEPNNVVTPCQVASTLLTGVLGAEVPQCEADGSFSPMQCSGSTGYCWCVDQHGIEIEGTRKQSSLSSPQDFNCQYTTLTACQAEATLLVGVPGVHVPHCEEDGSFTPKQCCSEYGQCWCVNQNGIEIHGSRVSVNEELECEVVDQDLTSCQIRSQVIEMTGLLGSYIPHCEADGSYSPKQCRGSTGECWCVNEDGVEIEGTRQGPGGEELQCDGTEVVSPCRLAASNSPALLGAYIPQCQEDGSYSPKQCRGSTGECWCVNENGDEVEGTRQGPTATTELTCEVVHLTPCQIEAALPRIALLGVYIPECQEDGSYSPKQCRGSTGECWCVDQNGVEIQGTRQGPTATTELVCGQSQELTPCLQLRAQSTGLIGAYKPQCEADGSFSPKQCRGSTGTCWCVNQNGVEINGTRQGPGASTGLTCGTVELTPCQSEAALAASLTYIIAPYIPQCEADGSYSPKQCHGSIGSCWCVNENGVEIEGTRQGPTVTTELTCGTVKLTPCQSQVAIFAANTYIIAPYIPQCEVDGSFSPKQCYDFTASCWCVDKDGVEIEGTRQEGSESTKLFCLAELTPCLQLRAQSTGLIGAYKPQCEADGSFSPKQCHGSTGSCWCVDQNGAEIDGTRQGPISSAVLTCDKAVDCSATKLTATDKLWCCQNNGEFCDEIVNQTELEFGDSKSSSSTIHYSSSLLTIMVVTLITYFLK